MRRLLTFVLAALLSMLNFIFCFVVLGILGFIFRALWRAIITPVNRHFVVSNTPTGPLQLAWFFLQVYVVFGWAAICVAIAHLFIAKPGVVFRYGYYVLSFFGCVTPLYDPTQGSTNTIAWFSVAAFLAFSIFPSLTLPWHWFLQFI